MAPCASAIGCGPALLEFVMRELDELRAPKVGLAEGCVPTRACPSTRGASSATTTRACSRRCTAA
jgi:hypothetical protein